MLDTGYIGKLVRETIRDNHIDNNGNLDRDLNLSNGCLDDILNTPDPR